MAPPTGGGKVQETALFLIGPPPVITCLLLLLLPVGLLLLPLQIPLPIPLPLLLLLPIPPPRLREVTTLAEISWACLLVDSQWQSPSDRTDKTGLDSDSPRQAYFMPKVPHKRMMALYFTCV